MKKIISILSLSHSGSTFLTFQLSKHKDVLGLGELVNIKRWGVNKDTLCSCRKNISECSFWKNYTDLNNFNGWKEFYERLFKITDKKIIVDSSKNLKTLEEFKATDLNIQVIFLIRDVRGWVLSIANKRKKKGKNTSIFLSFLSWFKENYTLKKYLKKNNINYLKVYYENLVFKNNETLKEIFDYMDIDNSSYLNYGEGSHHVLFGNRMKDNQLKKENIVYDIDWFNNYKVNLFYILFYPIMEVLKC